MIYVVN